MKLEYLLKNLKAEFYYILISIILLFIAMLIHEFGHYISALYYGLNPYFGVDSKAIYVRTDFLNAKMHEIVSHAGPIFNLVTAFIVLIILFLRGLKCSIKDYTCFILFLAVTTNLLTALISLILFPYTGVL